MHAVLITFGSTVGLDRLREPFTDYAHALTGVDGLILKAWIEDGATLGGFHLFADRASAEAYLAGDLLAGVKANPAFGPFEVRHFGVIDDLSAINGSPTAVPATTFD